MNIKSHSKIKDIVIISSDKFKDDRGYFIETYQRNKIDSSEPIWFTETDGGGGYKITKKTWPPKPFVQDNFVSSIKNVIRGLHFQKDNPQGKLVRCISGIILDVAVDIRKGSNTYGEWISVELSEENGDSLWIPEGFAHGYSVLSDTAKVLYKCTDIWYPDDESGIIWNDKTLNIDWKVLESDAIVSDKDKKLKLFEEI